MHQMSQRTPARREVFTWPPGLESPNDDGGVIHGPSTLIPLTTDAVPTLMAGEGPVLPASRKLSKVESWPGVGV